MLTQNPGLKTKKKKVGKKSENKIASDYKSRRERASRELGNYTIYTPFITYHAHAHVKHAHEMTCEMSVLGAHALARAGNSDAGIQPRDRRQR